MSLTQLINKPCSIISRSPGSTPNEFGWKDRAESVTSTVCEIQQDMADENAGDNDMSKTRWRIFFPVGTEIDADDVVSVDGLEYEVDGEAWAVRNPRTQTMSHVEANVVRVGTGGGS